MSALALDRLVAGTELPPLEVAPISRTVLARPTCFGTVRTVQDGRATLDLAVRLADGTTTLTGSAVVDLG